MPNQTPYRFSTSDTPNTLRYPILMTTQEWTTISRSAEDTQAIGRAIGATLTEGSIVLLMGRLGAGKTTLTQGIAAGLGVDAYTKSPSFVLVNEYDGRLPLFHMDLYRIDDAREAWDLGLDDYLSRGGVLAVEWADRATSVFPNDRLEIRIEYLSDSERRLTLKALGDASAEIVAQVQYADETRKGPGDERRTPA